MIDRIKGLHVPTCSFSAVSDKPSAKPTSHPSSPLHTFSSPRSSPFLTHNGPNCYVKPSAKSNRKIIRNALCHVCLAGDVNLSAKKLAISVCCIACTIVTY